MKLTEKQLDCMKLGADKTLSFGSLIYQESLGFKIVLGINPNRNKDVFSQEYRLLYRDLGHPYYHEHQASLYFDNEDTFEEETFFKKIGHPITQGRLAYLFWKDCLNEYADKKYKPMEVYFNQNPQYFDKTILDRPEELIDLVLSFLQSL